MLLEAVLPAYRNGLKIRRAKWPQFAYMIKGESNLHINMADELDNERRFGLVCGGLHADDWEVVPGQTEETSTSVRKRVRNG